MVGQSLPLQFTVPFPPEMIVTALQLRYDLAQTTRGSNRTLDKSSTRRVFRFRNSDNAEMILLPLLHHLSPPVDLT